MTLNEWIANERAFIKTIVPKYERQPFVIALLVHGIPYAERCLRMFRTWLAEGNIADLCANRDVVVYFNADVPARDFIFTSDEWKALREYGVTAHTYLIPCALLASIPVAENKWLDLNHDMSVRFAKQIHGEYHMGAPDLLYCNGYFKDIMRLADAGHEVIINPILCANEEPFANGVMGWNGHEPLNLPAAALCAVAINNTHRCAINQDVMLGRIHCRTTDTFPENQQLLWRGNGCVYIASVNMNPMYLSARVVQDAPERERGAIDGELHLLINDNQPFYMPQKGDNLVIVEYSPADTKHGGFNLKDANTAAKYLVERCRADGLSKLRFFYQDAVLPCMGVGMAEDVIKYEMLSFRDKLTEFSA